MQICWLPVLNDYLSLDRISGLGVSIPQPLSRGRDVRLAGLTGALAFEMPYFFCWSLLKDGWRGVSGKSALATARLAGCQETSLDGRNLIYQKSDCLTVNLPDTKHCPI